MSIKHQVLSDLISILRERKSGDPEKSYVSQLYAKGADQICKKIGEEATELVIESIKLQQSVDENALSFKNEAADFLFHYLVLLSHHDVNFNDILDILAERMGVSGLEEKANRS